jgi:hypothetical protein
LSGRGSSWVTSLRLPPVSDTASGMPGRCGPLEVPDARGAQVPHGRPHGRPDGRRCGPLPPGPGPLDRAGPCLRAHATSPSCLPGQRRRIVPSWRHAGKVPGGRPGGRQRRYTGCVSGSAQGCSPRRGGPCPSWDTPLTGRAKPDGTCRRTGCGRRGCAATTSSPNEAKLCTSSPTASPPPGAGCTARSSRAAACSGRAGTSPASGAWRPSASRTRVARRWRWCRTSAGPCGSTGTVPQGSRRQPPPRIPGGHCASRPALA